MFKTPKIEVSEPEPVPEVDPIPEATDPSVREAQLEAERKGKKRKGRSSTLLAGPLGDGSYSAPNSTGTVLSGKQVLG